MKNKNNNNKKNPTAFSEKGELHRKLKEFEQ